MTRESVHAYVSAMAEFADRATLKVWYAHMSEQDIQEELRTVQEQSAAAAGSKPGQAKGGKA